VRYQRQFGVPYTLKFKLRLRDCAGVLEKDCIVGIASDLTGELI
jgi:hypothetical protein